MLRSAAVSDAWLVNGAVCDRLPAGDRGLHYGQGLFETMRLSGGELPLWQRHRARLLRGARTLGIVLDEAQVEDELARARALWPSEGVVKLIVTAGSGGGGYRAAAGAVPTRVIGYRPVPEPRAPLRLQVCSHRLPCAPALAGIKHLNRLDQVLAARELDPGCEGLLLDGSQRIVEVLSGNFFVKTAAGWRTPPLTANGVRGVLRELLLDAVFPALGATLNEADMTLSELCEAEAAFACNAVRGIEPVARIEGWCNLDIGAVAPISAALHRLVPCFAD